MVNDRVRWVNPDALIEEENILFAAGLRDCLGLLPDQRIDFFNAFLSVPVRSGKTEQVVLSKTARNRKWPYDNAPRIVPGSKEEQRFFRLLEERTGLMAQDIVAIYKLDSRMHKDHHNRWINRIEWNEETRFVLAGLSVFCTRGDKKAATHLIKKWLEIEKQNKYFRGYGLFDAIKQSHQDFQALLKESAWDTGRKQRFEQLLSSKEGTKDWTIQKLSEEYARMARIDWKLPRNQLLWAGLIRYGELSGTQAANFLETWFGRRLSRSETGKFQLAYSGMSASGKKMNDVAPINSSDTPMRVQEFENILKEKGWTIQKIKEAALQGVFNSPD